MPEKVNDIYKNEVAMHTHMSKQLSHLLTIDQECRLRHNLIKNIMRINLLTSAMVIYQNEAIRKPIITVYATL